MFLKSKIGLTIFALYEIIAIMLLHCSRTCDAMFGTMFCDDHVFKYFVVCVAFPLIVFLIVMWIMEIIKKIRRRHSLLYKAKHVVSDMASNLKDRVSENVSVRDVEKMITAALLLGIKKYADKNPRARGIINEIMGKNYADFTDTEYAEYAEYDDTDDDDDEYDDNKNMRNNKSRKSQSKNNKKKK